MKFISIYFFCATLMHTQFFRLPYFAGGNKQFLAKTVIFFKSTKMCLVCAYQKNFLSQTKVCYHVIIRCYYHCLNVFSLEEILTQNLKRSDFCPGTSFDPRIIYDAATKVGFRLQKLGTIFVEILVRVHRS